MTGHADNPDPDGSDVSSETNPKAPTLRPVDAATLMIIDRNGEGAQGAHGQAPCRACKFMPGKYVFPGGRIEAGDRSHGRDAAPFTRAAEQALHGAW